MLLHRMWTFFDALTRRFLRGHHFQTTTSNIALTNGLVFVKTSSNWQFKCSLEVKLNQTKLITYVFMVYKEESKKRVCVCASESLRSCNLSDFE
ncbi:hypothetical protein QL285_023373 [Trifolium repens]|nr:hypothetical protein QL285_023373 [Trifolium repens]